MSTKKFLILIVLFVSCSGNENKGILRKEENGGDNVYSLSSDDDEMNRAIDTAVRYYDEFLSKFNNPGSNNSDFSVKMMFAYDGGNEHMWVNEMFNKGERLYGLIDSDPVYATSVKAGDTIEVNKNNISDWMYLKNDTLIGGYTIKVLYNKMSEKEKIRFKSEVAFILE